MVHKTKIAPTEIQKLSWPRYTAVQDKNQWLQQKTKDTDDPKVLFKGLSLTERGFSHKPDTTHCCCCHTCFTAQLCPLSLDLCSAHTEHLKLVFLAVAWHKPKLNACLTYIVKTVMFFGHFIVCRHFARLKHKSLNPLGFLGVFFMFLKHYLTLCWSWWGLLSDGNQRAGTATYRLLCVSPAVSNSHHHMLTLYSPNTTTASLCLFKTRRGMLWFA